MTFADDITDSNADNIKTLAKVDAEKRLYQCWEPNVFEATDI